MSSKISNLGESESELCALCATLLAGKIKFVQKSVGNNLNDLMKEDPAIAREIIAE